MSEKTKIPAVAGTTAGVHENIICHRGKEHPCYDDYNTEAAFCQAIIREIDECAREIYDNTTDNESAAYNAGKIQGLVYALTLIRGIKS